jgi:hypothetical protein
MLSRFFNNSKPIVLISLICLISIWYWGYVLLDILEKERLSLSERIINWLILLCVVIIIDFIDKKSKINKQNSYTLVSFVVLSLSIPEIFYERKILLSTLFLVLALRRIINLQNPVNTKKKIFEASIWLFFASLYEPWLALGYAILYFAIIYFVAQNFKNFFIPLFGALGGYTTLQLYHVLIKNNWHLFPANYFYVSLELNNWIVKPGIYLIIVYIFLVLWVGSHAGKILKKAKISKKTNLGILTAFMFLGFLNASFYSSTFAQDFFFIFIPFSFLLGNYFQLKQRKIIKEIVFGMLVSLPLLKLVLVLY